MPGLARATRNTLGVLSSYHTFSESKAVKVFLDNENMYNLDPMFFLLREHTSEVTGSM